MRSRLGFWSLAVAAPVLMFVGTSLDRYYQADFWRHLARGRAIVTRGEIVNEDIFTFTVPGRPLIDPAWLTQVLYYHLYETGGFGLVVFVNSLTLSATLAILVYLCWRASRFLVVATSLGLFAFFALLQVLIVRPQTFSFFLFALLFLILELSQQRRWLLWLVPPLMALWANLHGGFPIGLVLLSAYLVGAVLECWQRRSLEQFLRSRDLALALAAGLFATCLNPYGLSIYHYVMASSGIGRARGSLDWQPPGTAMPIGKMWATSLVLALVACALPRRRPTPGELVRLAFFLPLACGAWRMIVWWLLVSLPVVAAQFGPWLPRERFDDDELKRVSPLLGGTALATLFLLAVLSVPGVGFVGRNPVSRTEVNLHHVCDHLQAARGEGKNVFTNFEWGDYLAWAAGPDGYRVNMHGSLEVFPNDVWDEYMAVRQGRADWQEILERRGVDWLLLDEEDASVERNLRPLVERSGNWKKVYQVGSAVLFLKDPRPHED
jgi:hypothetical protein